MYEWWAMEESSHSKNKSVPDPKLVGYCGLYCGACDILRLYREGVETGRTPEWSDLPERLREHLPFKPSPIRCHGCKSDTVFAGCGHCPLRSCALKRANVEICSDCEKYPCLRIRLVGLMMRLFSVMKKLPHQQTKEPNLARIRSVGVVQWLAEQEHQWRCPQCHSSFSWYRATCTSCGKDLTSLKGFLVHVGKVS